MKARLTARNRAALRFIARRPRCLLKELAAELGSSIGSADRQASILRNNGFVRKPMGAKSFVLTPQGCAAVAELP